MKKLIVLICAAALLIGLLAVPVTAESGKPLKILIVSASGVDDGNFNQDCYLGIQNFLKNHPDCIVADVEEPDTTQMVSKVANLVGEYDVFVLPGFEFGAIGDVVLANPDKYFLVVDSGVTDSEGNPVSAPNVYTMTYKEQESGFLAGVAAALSTKTGKVAVINGKPIPSNLNYQFGFMAGVNYANTKYGTKAECVEISSFSGGNGVGGNYAGSFADPAAGKTVAEALIKEGCDVVFAAAGESGKGVLDAVREAEGVWFIGCDVDQYDDGAKGDGNVVLTSALKVMHLDVERELTAIYDGTFAGQNAVLGADTDSTGFVSAADRQQLSTDALARLDECLGKLKTKEVIPPCYPDYSPDDFPGLK